MFQPFFVIKTVSEERREVGGLITCERVDKDGDVLNYAGSKPAFQAWSDEAANATKGAGQAISYGNVREQHSKRMVGKFVEPLKFDDNAKTIWGLAKVYDDDVWQKVKDGGYTGFSVGGALGPVVRNGKQKLITIIPREVSLVDNPAVDSAHFDFIRASDGQVVKVAFHKPTIEDAISRAEQAIEILKAAVAEKFLAPELAPVANPPQDGSKVSSSVESTGTEWKVCQCGDPKCTNGPGCDCGNPNCTCPGCKKATSAMTPDGTSYAPDAIPDKSQPHAVSPTDGQVHLSADVRKYDPTTAVRVGASDTQLGKTDSEPKATMIGLDTKGAKVSVVEKHDHVEEPGTHGTAVTPDPNIEVTDQGRQLEQFGLPADPQGVIPSHTEKQPLTFKSAESVSDPESPDYDPEDPDYDPELDSSSKEYDPEKAAKIVVKVSPSGWSDTVESMKEHPEIGNPWALAWWMDGEGYTPQKFSKAAAVEFMAVFNSAIEKVATCEKKAFSDEKRAELADKGHAMPDGSYPIENASDLSNAVQAFGRHPTDAVKAHIKKRAADLGKEDLLPDTWKAASSKNELQKVSIGARIMANEVEKAARKGMLDHLQGLKGHADKMKAAVDGAHAAIHECAEKCMKLAGGPAFDPDTEREGGQPASGTPADTEVKAAKAEIEKLAGLVQSLTAQVAALAKPVEKVTEKVVEKAVESVVGDLAKAQPVEVVASVDKFSEDKALGDKRLQLAKSAFGITTVQKEIGGKMVERNERTAPDNKAMDSLYYEMTDARQYRASHPSVQIARK